MSHTKLSSLELLERCHEKGMISKEAYDRLHAHRKELIKEAVGRLMPRLLGLSKAPVEKAAPKGFLGNLKDAIGRGGITPPKGAKGDVSDAAGWGDVTGNLGKVLMLAGLTAGGLTGIGAAGGAIKRGLMNKQIDKAYKEMFNEFPELKDRNPNVVRSHFGVLRKFAPSLATNPLVAGSFIRSTTGQAHGIDPNTIQMLAKTQSLISQYPDTPLQHGLTAAKMIGGAVG